MKRSLATTLSVGSSALLVLGLAACGGGASDAGSMEESTSMAPSTDASKRATCSRHSSM